MSNNIKITVLDGYTLNPGDISWKSLEAMGTLTIYEYTPIDKMVEYAQGANIIIANKAILNAHTINALPELKCICVSATGYNNVDVEAAKNRGIPVMNVAGYGSHSVAQHVFAMILHFTNQISLHNDSVQRGDWSKSRDFCYTLTPITGLRNKTIGIYGLGRIGQTVADIAHAFGMRILATHKHPERDVRPGVSFVDIDTLFSESDFITLHAPLNHLNEGIVNKALLSRMKSSGILINTGRGGLINEKDLHDFLVEQKIGGAALDVLSTEPPAENHILFGLKNCVITPHNAWANRSARQKLLDETIKNIESFMKGNPRNVVNQ